ncbi:glycerophosphocholine phosphodiesterase GPCPD1-like [Onthophagus taurus]|uniref:glycerophosphocholine phosphodiesterase GPCPD1-like n=1 Tax=Onthophagus taurus TaxID=166361 RepID=UPI0039BEBBB9
MQEWFFLEDPNNDLIRHAKHTLSEMGESEEESEESIKYRPWLFRICVPPLQPDEVVCVIGSTPELGSWEPEKCKPLVKGRNDVWSIKLKVPINQRVFYRYCICIIIEPEVKVLIRSWETNINPRIIKPECPSPKPTTPCQTYGNYDEEVHIDKGWLTEGTITMLQLTKNPFKLFRPRFQDRTIYVKITPVSLVKHYPKKVMDCQEESLSVDHMEDKPKFSYVEVAELTSDSDYEFVPQGQFGHKYVSGDFLTFKIFLVNRETTAFLIDFYIYSSKAIDDEPPYHAGFTYLLPGAVEHTKGSVVLPLTSMKQRPLGELRLNYLVIKPLENFNCNMEVSYQRYWNKDRTGLNIGHRGSGNSFKTENCADIRENTIASLKTAINVGADFVEFDVQLTKDLVPIIYHDFYVCIATHKKKNLEDTDMFELPLRDLTSEQLTMLKIYHLVEGKSKLSRFADDDLEDHQPFPTLQSALEILDTKSGFNIEIKCPNKLLDGGEELRETQDLNIFVDTILEVVLQYAGVREIVFSSFNPDVVSMVRLKQNKYPVMFLTQGDTKRYPPYDDQRCWNMTNAVHFSKMHEILGVSAHTEDILRDASLAQYGLDKGIIMFCWGDDLDDVNTITYVKDLGLHGIIYDKICQYLDREDKDNIYLLEGRESQKELIRIAATAPPEEPEPDYPFKKTKLDYERDNVSTATSLESLESEMDRVAKVKGRQCV